jgi:hypothetical protein
LFLGGSIGGSKSMIHTPLNFSITIYLISIDIRKVLMIATSIDLTI